MTMWRTAQAFVRRAVAVGGTVRGRGGDVCAPAARRNVSTILTYPHEILRKVCDPLVDTRAPAVRELVDELVSTAEQHDAMGLAAPQVARTQRAFVMLEPLYYNDQEALKAQSKGRGRGRGRVHSTPPPRRFIPVLNPAITARSEHTAVGLESCLSIPDSVSLVRRAYSIVVTYTHGITGEAVTRHLTGLPAVVFQHELDHLEGTLITDRESTTFPEGRTVDEAFTLAQERWFLELMKYYGVEPRQDTPQV